MTEWCRHSALPIRLCTAPAASSSPAARYSGSADSRSSRARWCPRPDRIQSMAAVTAARAWAGRGAVASRSATAASAWSSASSQAKAAAASDAARRSNRAVTSGSAALPAPWRCVAMAAESPRTRSLPRLQGLGRGEVQAAQPRPGDLGAQRVPHHAVGEGVAPAPGVPRLDEQAGGHALVQGLCHVVGRSTADLREQLDVDLCAEERGDGQDLAGPLGQVGEPVPEHVAHPGGNRQAAATSGLAGDRDQLDRVEGVAPGALPQVVGEDRRGRRGCPPGPGRARRGPPR